MVFSEAVFIFLFFAASLLFYYIIPQRYRKLRNGALLLLSLVFYGWGETRYLPLMVGTIVLDWLFGAVVGRLRSSRPAAAKMALAVCILLNIGALAVFKYLDLIVAALRVFPVFSSIEAPGLPLPIGISFYTFQALSYVVDVYRGDAAAQKNPAEFGTYVALFPQLIAGPIVRYRDVAEQLAARRETLPGFAVGAQTFICGLCKKVLVANVAGAMWERLRDLPPDGQTALGSWLGIIFFTLQIYYDFSGYSDMAIGLGRMFGFSFRENFDHPYTAVSVTDFWRRWHISLSSWFRDYLYIPLGGSRCGAARQIFNLLIVWAATGLWHGASLNYLLWGLYYFVLLVAERYLLRPFLGRLPAFARHILTLAAVVGGWLIFVFEDLAAGSAFLGVMLGSSGVFADGMTVYELVRHIPFLLIAAVGCTPLPRNLWHAARQRSEALRAATLLCSLAAFVVCVAYIVSSSYNPFLYFRF